MTYRVGDPDPFEEWGDCPATAPEMTLTYCCRDAGHEPPHVACHYDDQDRRSIAAVWP